MKKIFLLLLITSYGMQAAAKKDEKEEKNVLRLDDHETKKVYIQGVRGVSADIGDAIPVFISSEGQLVTY